MHVDRQCSKEGLGVGFVSSAWAALVNILWTSLTSCFWYISLLLSRLEFWGLNGVYSRQDVLVTSGVVTISKL